MAAPGNRTVSISFLECFGAILPVQTASKELLYRFRMTGVRYEPSASTTLEVRIARTEKDVGNYLKIKEVSDA